MRFQTILDDIGSTPHVRLNRLFGGDAEVWMKLERNNPGGSIKDRIGLSMIEDAEQSGALTKSSVIVEPTSGNTGLGLAMVAAVKGYELILVMPESMTIERRRLMALYGARLELTPREGGMKGAIDRARELAAEMKNAWMPMQFENPANVTAHRERTAAEIVEDFPEGLDALVTGVGTGGHITGCAEVLKARFPDLKVLAVEPAASPVLSGGEPGPHPIQGIGAGFVPEILRPDLLDEVVPVPEEEAFDMALRCAREEGILVGISSGASLAAVDRVLPTLPPRARVLTFCYDTGERYLSLEHFQPADAASLEA